MRPRACLILLASLVTRAAYADVERVVIADPDPELQRAIVTTLAPWRLEVLVEPKPPADIEEAKSRAGTANARFVVWRHGRDLLVFERERDAVEQRATSGDTLDEARAAQAALTVKTLMRLPPPPADGAGSDVAGTSTSGAGSDVTPGIGSTVTPVSSKGPEIRVQAGADARFDSVESGVRASLVASIRPTAKPWRIGVLADLGGSAAVDQESFVGDWTHWAVLGLASWTVELGRIELEPFVAGGITRSVLDGKEANNQRRETAVLATGRGGAWIRLPLGRFSIGGSVAAESLIGPPAYLKTQGASMNEVFAVPGFAFDIGLFAAAAFEP